jgi:uncharacterized integral membrane protein (TIGR00697 family)
MNDVISLIIQFLQSLPNEAVGLIMYTTAIAALFTLQRAFGKEGLFLYIVLMVMIANIQTLKGINLAGFASPVAMGTILFTTSFLATDIIAEFYGRKEAEKAIWLSFSSTLLISVFMILTLGTKPADTPERYLQAHQAIAFIFTPATAIFIASLTAYLVSQYSDVTLFLWIKKLTGGKFLGLRTVVATVVSTLLDNAIFSLLAWKVLYPLSLDFTTFMSTYILGTSVLRILISLANTPIIYLLRRQTKEFSNVAYVS